MFSSFIRCSINSCPAREKCCESRQFGMVHAMFGMNLLKQSLDFRNLRAHKHVVGAHDVRDQLGQRSSLQFAIARAGWFGDGSLQRLQHLIKVRVERRRRLRLAAGFPRSKNRSRASRKPESSGGFRSRNRVRSWWWSKSLASPRSSALPSPTTLGERQIA